MGLTFVHAADLHLDSPFAGLAEVDPEIAALCREATFGAFERIVDLCIDREVDFLLIAGDIYDSDERSLRAQLSFRDGLTRLDESGIRAYIVHGNHDPLDQWISTLNWPKGVHVFRGGAVQSLVHESRDGSRAVIHGMSFPTRKVRQNLAKKFKRSSEMAFHIGLLHCNVGSNTGHEPYAPCMLDDLICSGLDYWALGHVHSKNVLSSRSPAVVYPGNSQGRNTREGGPRGCYYVEVDTDGSVALEFAPTDRVRWFDDEIEIKKIESEDSLLNELETKIEATQREADGRPALLRIKLTGRGELHDTLQRTGYVGDLTIRFRDYGRARQPLVWMMAIVDRTRPAVDVAERRRSQDIIGDFLRLVEEYESDDTKMAELGESLKPLFEDRRLRKVLSVPSSKELRELLNQAEGLCLDRLLEDAGQ